MRALCPLLVLVFALSGAVGACSSADGTDSSGDGTATDSANGGMRSMYLPDASFDPTPNTPTRTNDAGTTPADAAVVDTGRIECIFNRDCSSNRRCECTDADGCWCEVGARGTGSVGVTPCTSGNDCASSLCVEGPLGSPTLCSDECTTSNDCAGDLPICATIGFIGQICVRTPPR
ncbi:MAG: hypothetical protein R3A78_04745 [Polyangiales bacterium]|nr:hypothetical protein [Myxococcales bacterium]